MPATIVLTADDCKREDIVSFVKKYKSAFARYNLIATQTTGLQIQSQTDLNIELLLSKSMGGCAQIATHIAAGEIKAVICLVDPLTLPAHSPDTEALIRICNVYNIPIATNLATAEAIAEGLVRLTVAHLIFNPISGNGDAAAELNLIKDLLEPAMTLHVHQTTSEIEAKYLTQKAIATGADLIIASGGDGTVSEVAGELLETNIPLGIIPRGTANAFAAAIGIPSLATPIRRACEVILQGNTRIVDVARCNGIPMLLLAAIGYEAEMVEKANREAKNQWGALAYLMAGWQQLSQQEIFDVQIKIDGKIDSFQASAVTVANAAPPTSIFAQGIGRVIFDDGVLDTTIVTAEGGFQAAETLLNMFGAALIKTEVNRDNVFHFRAQQIEIIADPPQKIAIDGEIIGETPAKIECIPQGLCIIAPPATSIV